MDKNNIQLTPYQQTIRDISDRIVETQRPIRILDAIKWEDSVQQTFFEKKAQEQPQIDLHYYQQHPLHFDPEAKRQQFHEIERDIVKKLGNFSPVGQIMRRICREYQMVVRMLEARGTPDFSRISEELYGSASEAFHAGDPTLADLGQTMEQILKNIPQSLPHNEQKTIRSEEAVIILQQRLNQAFGENTVRVFLSDGVLADAAAGADYLKIRKEAMFNERDIQVLEVHEGLVHLGTTLNGSNQPICTFLSKGPPSSTITQEGLAILMEIFTFVSTPQRLRKLTNRIRAIHLADNGATFLDIFRYFHEQNYTELESYYNTVRVFRGSIPTGRPFTKDLCYHKGFILVYNFIQLAVQKGMLERIPLLFCGKTTLEDNRTLAQLVEEGLVQYPKFLPPQFADLKALTAWMCYSNFLNRLNIDRIATDYANII